MYVVYTWLSSRLICYKFTLCLHVHENVRGIRVTRRHFLMTFLMTSHIIVHVQNIHLHVHGFESHPRHAAHFTYEKWLPWVCCVALPCSLFDLACFFLPSFSHLSLKHVYTCVCVCVYVCVYMCVYTCMCVCVYVYMYMYTCIMCVCVCLAAG